MNSFWRDYPDIGKSLDAVSRIIIDSVDDSDDFIKNAISDSVASGGKMLRPAFVLLSAKFGKYNEENIFKLAAVIEMLHMATLVHDDIIDDSKLRRGVESIQSKYGKDTAVFIGDYLFAKCFTLISRHHTIETMELLSKAILRICRGELKQYSLRYRYDESILKYLKVITGKTAALFSMSFYIGAFESGCDEKTTKKLSRAGYYVGMAFQIIDDCLDYSNNETIKKSTMNDLKQGYLTLPVIYALNNDRNAELKNLLEKTDFNEADIRLIHQLVEMNSGLEFARQLAKKYTVKAFKLISTLPDIENRKILEDIIKQLLNRHY
ncbi:MAG: polyprenyl synthetase family protein [Eubacteriaceae bacterium]|nr:polyprenyl synthetase family protein [Eubacteriaceae bacterium]